MELSVNLSPEDMNDQFDHMSILGDFLYCDECNRRIAQVARHPRAQIILKLAMHVHGIETV